MVMLNIGILALAATFQSGALAIQRSSSVSNGTAVADKAMEAYRGLAILTTNMKQALDPAFLRRIRFIVQFPFPDAPQRSEIWRRIFPAHTPTEGLDVARLRLVVQHEGFHEVLGVGHEPRLELLAPDGRVLPFVVAARRD